jgi:vacuolar-type H+-ATPase subunit E/Vma4
MTPEITAALEPVQAALLARARADANDVLAAADADAARAAGSAQAESEQIRAAARSSGAADAKTVRATELAGAPPRGAGLVLAAQRAAYEELRRRTRKELTAAGTAGRVRAALAARARAVLGPDARIVDRPAGGVVGEAAGRRVDCSVDALVERALTVDAGRLNRLWSP